MTRKLVTNQRGMTLVEVMMAVALLGVVLLFITKMTGGSSRLTEQNLHQLRMMELAQQHLEQYLAGNKPPTGDVTTMEGYTYHVTRNAESGIIKVTVGPLPFDQDNWENFVLVTWSP